MFYQLICILFFSRSVWPKCVLFTSVAPERSGPGVPGQVSTATRGDPRVCAGQQQGQAKWRWPSRKARCLLDSREAQPQGVAVGGRHGGGLVGTGVRHAALGGLASRGWGTLTDWWILFKDKTDSTLVLILTSGRISWNLSLDWWVEVLSMESVVLCGKKRNSVMYMVHFLCICMSPSMLSLLVRSSDVLLPQTTCRNWLTWIFAQRKSSFIHYCFYLSWYHNRQLWSSVRCALPRLWIHFVISVERFIYWKEPLHNKT